jgi:hypothetical protein
MGGWTGDWEIKGFTIEYEYFPSWAFHRWNGCQRIERIKLNDWNLLMSFCRYAQDCDQFYKPADI